jgi:hypothetical protein
MLPKKDLPEKIKDSNENKRGIPMKINYNKRPLPLQGSGHLVKKINRAV